MHPGLLSLWMVPRENVRLLCDDFFLLERLKKPTFD
jgi:hypothetical protein